MLKAQELGESLRKEIIGQDKAVDAVVRAVMVADLGICDPQRPLSTFLLLGPTGTGKSQIGRSLAKILHGDEHEVVVVNCTEFKNPHDVAKLVGAPPGYIGHEQPPFLTPEKLSKKFTIVIFEELEKADRALYDLLLQVLERGELKTGRGVDLNFTNCFIFMTTNIAAKNIDRIINNERVGFNPPCISSYHDMSENEADALIRTEAMKVVEDFFSPEFINRADEIVVFKQLRHEQMLTILDKFLLDTRARCAMAGIGTAITDAARNFLINVGTNLRYGARPLRRAVREHLEFPLANFINQNVPGANRVILIDFNPTEKKLFFSVGRAGNGIIAAA